MSTQELLQRAAAHMTPNYNPPPFILSHGQGTRLWDTDGREYLDFAGGIGVNAVGHGNPRVSAAIAQQASKLSHTSNLFFHESYILLCARIAELSFGTRVFLTNSGTEAVEAALKTARRYYHARGERRSEFVAANNSFHGRTLGALSVTGQATYHEGFGPLVPGAHFVPYGDVAALRAALTERTAAVILEPIQGNGGVLLPPPGYLQAIRAACDAAGCLLIFDEVQSGVGRTGRWFAHQHEGVLPDIMSLAKMLGGGLPLGAMVTTDAIAAALTPGSHATTFGGNPVACVAGLTTIQIIEDDGLLAHATRVGEQLLGALQELAPRHQAVQGTRGRGLMLGLVLDRPAKPLQQACIARGLLATVAGGHVLRLLPPLTVSTQEAEEAVRRIADALGEL